MLQGVLCYLADGRLMSLINLLAKQFNGMGSWDRAIFCGRKYCPIRKPPARQYLLRWTWHIGPEKDMAVSENGKIRWMEEILHQLIGGLILLFIGFQPTKVMQDFFHPPYVCIVHPTKWLMVSITVPLLYRCWTHWFVRMWIPHFFMIVFIWFTGENHDSCNHPFLGSLFSEKSTSGGKRHLARNGSKLSE